MVVNRFGLNDATPVDFDFAAAEQVVNRFGLNDATPVGTIFIIRRQGGE